MRRRELVALSALVACLGERPLGGGRGGVAGAGSAGDTPGGGGGGSTSVLNDGGVSGGDSGDAGVMGGLVAAQLAFTQLEAAAYASSPLGLIAVSIQDVDGILVSAAEDTVTLALANNPGGANLIGYLTAQAQAGVAVFDTVGLDQVGAGYTFTASAAGLSTATSQPFDVAPLPFERVATGLYGGIASHLALSTDNPATLYVTGPAGVFRSINAGGSWASANFGNAGAVGLVAVDPLNSSRVYTTPSFGSGSFSGAGFYVTKSDSAGDAWRTLEGLTAGGLSGAQVGTFVIDPANPNILYAGNFAGIFRSANGGDTWVQTSFPFANYALTIDPIAPTTLYAYAYDQNAGAAQGIYKTVDSGTNWVPVNNPSLPEAITTGPMALLATPGAVFVNEFRSTNGGASWVLGATLANAYAYAPSNPQRVYSGRGGAVRVSDNGGETFGPEVETGGVRLNSLVVDTVDADRVYAATDTGVFASSDGGASWESSSIGITALQLGAVVMNPTTAENVLVGGPTGVYLTTNGGVTWLLSVLSVSEDLVTALTIDPVDPAIVYACTLGATFYRSNDGGLNWSAGVSTGGGPYCYDIAVSGQTLWVPTVGGVRRSNDGGLIWEEVAGLSVPSYSIAVDPNGTTLYAGTNQGTYKSINTGVDWELMTDDLAKAFLIDPMTPSTVYMGLDCAAGSGAQSSGGTRRSTNSGVDWQPVVQGSCIDSLLRLADGRLLAAGRGFPAFAVSVDQGVSWQPGGVGINGEPAGLAASSDGQTVYVPTLLGLYKSVTGGL
jgi:hypothetical protein